MILVHNRERDHIELLMKQPFNMFTENYSHLTHPHTVPLTVQKSGIARRVEWLDGRWFDLERIRLFSGTASRSIA